MIAIYDYETMTPIDNKTKPVYIIHHHFSVSGKPGNFVLVAKCK